MVAQRDSRGASLQQEVLRLISFDSYAIFVVAVERTRESFRSFLGRSQLAVLMFAVPLLVKWTVMLLNQMLLVIVYFKWFKIFNAVGTRRIFNRHGSGDKQPVLF